jgi:hypothetical protein
MTEIHPFAQYVRILGRGRTLSRSLTFERAEVAMGMILRDEVLPKQLGAFMMLLRVKEETADEIAGFVQAVRNTFDIPQDAPIVDLDWSTYAGKRRQLPWFLLAALTLVQSGVRVFMRGTEGHTPGRMYTRATLEALGYPIAMTLNDAADNFRADNFAFLLLQSRNPMLYDLIQMRNILACGRQCIRSHACLIHLARPACCKAFSIPDAWRPIRTLQIFWGKPSWGCFAAKAAKLNAAPTNPSRFAPSAMASCPPRTGRQCWVTLRQAVNPTMDIGRLRAVWSGEIEDDYAVAAIIDTLGIALAEYGQGQPRQYRAGRRQDGVDQPGQGAARDLASLKI